MVTKPALLLVAASVAASCGGRIETGLSAPSCEKASCGRDSATYDTTAPDGVAQWESDSAPLDARPAIDAKKQDDADTQPSPDSWTPSPDATDDSTTPTSSDVLPYRVVAAAFSAPLSRVVIASDSPTDALLLVEPSSGTTRTLPLPSHPLALAVDQAGVRAAVAGVGHVSWIDLSSGSIISDCPTAVSAYDAAMDNAGTVYVTPYADQYVSLHVFRTTSCADAQSNTLWPRSRLAVHPNQSALLATSLAVTPQPFDRCGLSAASLSCQDAMNATDVGRFAYGGSLWLDGDGTRAYTASGVVVVIPADVQTGACSYGGIIGGLGEISHLDAPGTTDTIALIPGPTTAPGDTRVQLYSKSYLGLLREYSIPAHPTPSGSVVSHGRYVFQDSATASLIVLSQADSSAGVLYDYELIRFLR